MENYPAVIKSLINSYAVLVMAKRMTMEDVPDTKTVGGVAYEIKSNVEIVIAERIINAIG